MPMNTRQRLHRFAEERRIYVSLCRAYYGYTPRARVRAIGASNMAGFLSALLGCGLTLTFYSAIDATFLNLMKSVQTLTLNDILTLVISTFQG